MNAYVYDEYAIATPWGAVMPLAGDDLPVARAVARPYLLNGALLVTRQVTVAPVVDSGKAAYRLGPWREIPTGMGVLRAVA